MEALQNPVLVVAVAKLSEGGAQLIQASKSAQPKQLLFERPEESLDAPVGLRCQLSRMATVTPLRLRSSIHIIR